MRHEYYELPGGWVIANFNNSPGSSTWLWEVRHREGAGPDRWLHRNLTLPDDFTTIPDSSFATRDEAEEALAKYLLLNGG